MPVILITGASQGIGAAIAKRFAQEPQAQLVLVARSVNKLQQVARQCQTSGAEVWVYPADVTQENAIDLLREEVLEAWGAPDVLINNAGQFKPGSTIDTTPTDFQQQLAVNLTSAFLITRAFLPAMLQRKHGHIFFMGSVASIRAYPNGAAYCAAKHGLLGFARVVREETKNQGIRVTTLLPGATLTPSWEGTDLPPERFMPPEDIAAAVYDIYRLSPRTVVEEIILRPQAGDI